MADSSMQGVFNDLVEGLDKCTEALYYAAKSFSGTNTGSGTSNKSGSGSRPVRNSKTLEASLRDAEKMFDRSSKNTNQALTMTQKISKTFITSLQAVGRVFIQEFKSSISRVSSDYLSNLTTITARMQLSNEQYAGLYNEYASKISKDFKGAFSVKDFSSTLVNALETGLRGQDAKDIAYRNMITNKLVPAISTNTQAYRRMSVTLGDAFNKNITAMAKYAESINAATGIEEGKLNANIETFEKEFMYQASKEGYSKEDASEAFAQFQLALAKTTSVYGEETTQYIVDQLKGNINGIIGSASVSSALDGTFTPEQAMEALLEPTGPIGNILTSLEKIAVNENNDTISVLADKLGYSIDAIHQVGIQANWGMSSKEFSQDLIKELNGLTSDKLNQVYNTETSKLEEGYYTSADDYFSNQIDNATTFISTWKSNIARFDTKLDLIKITLGAILTNLVFTKTKGSLSNLGGSGNGVFNNRFLGSTGDAMGGQSGLLGKLANKGYTLAGEGTTAVRGVDAAAKGLTGSASATAAGVGVGVGSLAVGGYMALKDAISVGKTNNSVGAGITAAFTGDSNRGLSEDQKIAKGQKSVDDGWVAGGIDWKKVGKNTLKGTALGAGIGTAVGGWALGSGTAIGAVVGAAGGALTSVVRQLADSAYYADLAKKSKAYSESLDALNTASVKYEESKQKELSITEILNKNNEDITKNDLSALKTAYPELLANVTDVSDLDESYIKILKAKIELERKEAADDVAEKTSTNIKDAKKVFDKKAKKSVGSVGEAEWEALQEMQSQGSISEDKVTEIAKKYKMSPDTLTSELKKWASYNSEGNLYVGSGTYKSAEKKYNESLSTDNQVKAIEDINSALSQIQSQSDQLASLWSYDMDSGWSYSGSDEEDFKKSWTEYNKYVSDIKSKINNTTGDANKVLLKSWEQIRPKLFGINKEITPDKNYVTPTFKVGTRNLSEDGLLYGHKGEMILTSSNADKLRSLESQGGISGILSGLLGLTKVTASPIDNSTQYDPITNAITQQTEVLSDILNRILEAVTGLNPNTNKTVKSNPVSVSSDLYSYEGA